MAPKAKTADHLRKQSKHLLYEIQMFCALGRYFETGEVDAAVAELARKGLPVRNAVIEAFEIHARQLIEVLTHQRNRKDAVARDWAKKWSVSQADRRDLKALRKAFSERVAHLSWRRASFTPEEQQVFTREIETKLQPLLLRFLDEANPELVCEGFTEEARGALSDRSPETENFGIQMEAVTRVVTTEAPATNTRGTAIKTFRN